jgi:hypothetical protein
MTTNISGLHRQTLETDLKDDSRGRDFRSHGLRIDALNLQSEYDNTLRATRNDKKTQLRFISYMPMAAVVDSGTYLQAAVEFLFVFLNGRNVIFGLTTDPDSRTGYGRPGPKRYICFSLFFYSVIYVLILWLAIYVFLFTIFYRYFAIYVLLPMSFVYIRLSIFCSPCATFIVFRICIFLANLCREGRRSIPQEHSLCRSYFIPKVPG